MNKILTKVLEELRADKPRIDYVIGMLETLVEMQVAPNAIIPSIRYIDSVAVDPLVPVTNTPKDEATILDGKARAAIEAVRALSEASTEK